MAGKSYKNMTLPELYMEAHRRNFKDFFKKNEEEMRQWLEADDAKHEEPEIESKSPVKAKGFRGAIEMVSEDEEVDDLLDMDELDADDEGEVPVSAKVAAKMGASANLKTNREDEISVEDDTDDLLGDIYGEDEEDEEEQSQPTSKKEKPAVAAKKKAVAKKEEKTEKKTGPGRGEIGDKAPYVVNSAGFCAFLALKNGGTMDTIVANTDKLVEKLGAKPPSNTAGKVKIIMTEINSGKKGEKWGKFVLNEKTKKISHQPA